MKHLFRLFVADEPLKKPVPLHEQTVKDEKGRYQRFHGAFTGGFSAGYFNTVGTKEGQHQNTCSISLIWISGDPVLGSSVFSSAETAVFSRRDLPRCGLILLLCAIRLDPINLCVVKATES